MIEQTKQWLITLAMLLCGFMASAEQITSISELSNTMLYYVSQPNHSGGATAWAVQEDGTALKSSNDLGITPDSNDTRQQFAFVTGDGGATRYLYHPAERKFVSRDGSLSTTPTDLIYFKDGAYDNTFVVYFDASHYINVGGSRQMTIDSWSYADGGNSCAIISVGEYDLSEVVIALPTIVQLNGIWYNLSLKSRQANVINNPDGSTKYADNVLIPSTVTYEGVMYSVTSIEYSAFRDCSCLSSVTIPESVMSIGSSAFERCNGLISVSIPENSQLTSIGNSAFSGCSSLTNITLPEGVASIGSSAFERCNGLISVSIPENSQLTSIGNSAFSGCSSLTSITIPGSVTSIGNSAFYDCGNLSFITVEEGNSVYDSRNDCNAIIETSTNTLILGCSTTIIPEGVTSIGNSAFSGCSSLTDITIPEGVTSIGSSAFARCSSLTSITIPEGVMSIGEYAFYNCGNLTSITIPENVTSIGNSAFRDCDGLTSITISEGVTSIEELAFSSCSSLTSVTISESVTSIGDYAFAWCSNLTSITCEAVTPPTMSSSTFEDINRNILFYIPATSLTVYQTSAYWSDFTNMQPINYYWISDNQGQPNSMSSETYTFTASIGDILTFDWQVSSERYDWLVVTLNGEKILKKSGEDSGSYQYEFDSSGDNTLTVEYIKDYNGNGNDDQARVYHIVLPSPSVIAHGFCGSNLVWKLNREYELIIEGTGEMNNYNYSNQVPWHTYCSEIKNIILDEDISSIGDYAFNECSSIASINIPVGVTGIGEHAFQNCSSLTDITLPEGVTSIEYSSFYGCSGITTVTIPNGVKTIPWFGFGWCESLQRIDIPESMENIERAAFCGCLNLNSIVIDPKNTVLDDCENNAIVEKETKTLLVGTTSGYIPEGIEVIGDYAFACRNINDIIIPSSVVSIKYCAFAGNSIRSVHIPSSVKEIDTHAFGQPGSSQDCMNLEAVYIEDLEAWFGIVFENSVDNPLRTAGNLYLNGELLESISVPEGITRIKNGALHGWNGKEIILPSSLTSISSTAFEDCSNLGSITCNAVNPPECTKWTFEDIDKFIPVYVPAESVSIYKAAEGWSEFTNIQPLSNEYTLTVSSAGYATMYLSYAAAIPDDVKVYIASNVEGDRLMMTEVEDVLPANTGVIVRAKAGTYTFVESDGAPANVEGNLLSGTATDTYITAESGYRYYVLAQKEGVVGMYRPKLTNGQFFNNANKAYLALNLSNLGIFDDETNTDEEGGQLSNRLRFDFGGTTGIEQTTDNSQQTTVIYDLQGRKVTDTEGLKGVYIVNGKKVVFR